VQNYRAALGTFPVTLESSASYTTKHKPCNRALLFDLLRLLEQKEAITDSFPQSDTQASRGNTAKHHGHQPERIRDLNAFINALRLSEE